MLSGMANTDDKKCSCGNLQSDEPGPEGTGTMDDGGYICGPCWQVAALSPTNDQATAVRDN